MPSYDVSLRTLKPHMFESMIHWSLYCLTVLCEVLAVSFNKPPTIRSYKTALWTRWRLNALLFMFHDDNYLFKASLLSCSWSRQLDWVEKPICTDKRDTCKNRLNPYWIVSSVTVPQYSRSSCLSNLNHVVSRLAWTRCINPSTPYINIWSSSAPTGRQQACGS